MDKKGGTWGELGEGKECDQNLLWKVLKIMKKETPEDRCPASFMVGDESHYENCMQRQDFI